MKRLVVIIALALSLGLGAYVVSYAIARCTFCRMPDTQEPSSWLQQEFHLSDAQYSQVKKLEVDYHPHCVEMCDKIKQSHLALKNLILANRGMTPEIEAALQKEGAGQAQWRADMLRHFYDVSQAMPPDEGKRYLYMMEAQVFEPTSNALAAPH